MNHLPVQTWSCPIVGVRFAGRHPAHTFCAFCAEMVSADLVSVPGTALCMLASFLTVANTKEDLPNVVAWLEFLASCKVVDSMWHHEDGVHCITYFKAGHKYHMLAMAYGAGCSKQGADGGPLCPCFVFGVPRPPSNYSAATKLGLKMWRHAMRGQHPAVRADHVDSVLGSAWLACNVSRWSSHRLAWMHAVLRAHRRCGT
jgi:hypothetical protein